MTINLAVVLCISFMWIFLVMWHGLQGLIFVAD